ncbi:DUF1292 domain-containing protein [Sporanaerobacter acetigenes]|uniref:Uncharacterized protein n=1 Tax=Sporanaerobacter acetigenes DSM 13106 TaxID=1123281 RepID=A0A1M5UCV3_9FIRM|nr:DUF1292 domain-containing protein [Sporanaerobacter acetigenes]SHH60770.1 Protein of unknown function [Sporanaerobacter acetigenes DSM 13106]
MDEKIVLIDEMGKEKEFEISATFGLDDFDYAVLFPADDLEGEAFILRIERDADGQVYLIGIDDEEELDDVILAYETIVKENMQ